MDFSAEDYLRASNELLMTCIGKINLPNQETSLNVTSMSSDLHSIASAPQGSSVPSSPSLCSSHSLSPVYSLSPKSIYDRLEFYEDTNLHIDQHLEENQKLRQEVAKYQLRVKKLEEELYQKNGTSEVDIRSLVQKTLQSALLDKERNRREADKERHKREELEAKLAQINMEYLKVDEEVNFDLHDKKEQIKTLQNQLVEAIQDIDHLQELNEETVNLLRHLYFRIPDFFLLSDEQNNTAEKHLEPGSSKFTLDNFVSKVTNLIDESHQMVDKILTLQTKNEQLASQLKIIQEPDYHETCIVEDVSDSDEDNINSRFKKGLNNQYNSDSIAEEESEASKESLFPLEDEEAQSHMLTFGTSKELDSSKSLLNHSSSREADVEMPWWN
ncbi:hypothetical protein K7432_007418 [Basidiobolus ranarum]|uniref:Uncharacterized protein n=1 Tax=Basidiobolus ranarum TaxID=34480 RepID=A0ABR2W049_9FUNG